MWASREDSVVWCLLTANCTQESHFCYFSTFSVIENLPNPKFQYRVYKSRPLVSVLSQTNKSKPSQLLI